MINLSKRVENNEEKARLSASFFVTFFREKKEELLPLLKTTVLWGERVSLSGVLFREEYPLERSFVVYRLSDCVWWCCAFAFASYVRFLFGSGEGAFFPLCMKKSYVYCHTQKQSSLISLESFSSNLSFVLGGEGGVRDEAQIFLKRSRSLSDDIFLCFLTQHQHKEEIYNNAAFPRVIP